MTRVQIWVHIPDGYELACDILRIPMQGEQFVANDGKVSIAHDDHALPRVIVRPAWQWPSWLKAAAIAMEDDGGWFAFDMVPTLDRHAWSDGLDIGTHLSESRFHFSPPPCTDWRQSLRLNPNREAKS